MSARRIPDPIPAVIAIPDGWFKLRLGMIILRGDMYLSFDKTQWLPVEEFEYNKKFEELDPRFEIVHIRRTKYR